jgi:hypothetical protein
MFKRFVGVVSVVVLSLILSEGGLAHAQTEDQCFAKRGRWDAETEQCTLKGGIELNLDYPLELADGGFMEETIDAYLDDLQRGFITDFADSGLTDSVGYPWTLYVDYETFPVSPELVSLKFRVETYTGGAHGIAAFKTFIFDLAENRLLTLDDLFLPDVDPLATVAPLVHDLALAQLDEMGGMSDADWIATGTEPLPENYQSYVLTDDSLVFFFPPYQLAAYAAGTQTISVPLSEIADALNPAFVP